MDGALAPAKDRVAVRRWSAQYLVPSALPDPQRVRARLDATLRDDMPGLLAAQLARVIDSRDTGLVFVRRLAFELAIDAAWDRDAIAARCAHALAATLSRELAADDGGNVIRFADRTEYLARYLADTAAGNAASRWYYAAFEGLAALPAGGAIRTVLLADPGAGLAALRRLEAADLAHVIAALGARECARVCDSLGCALPQGDIASAFVHLAAASRVHAAAPFVGVAPQLALWLIAEAQIPADRGLIIAAQSLAAVIGGLAAGRIAPDVLETKPAAHDALAALLADSPHDLRDALRACPPEVLRELAATRGAVNEAAATAADALGHTPFGGAFLLLDDLLALPLADLAARWPPAAGTAPERALAFLVLASCCGAIRAPALFADPLWRGLFGIHPSFTLDEAAVWLTTLGRARHAAFARMLARHQCEDDGARTSHRLDLPDGRYRLRMDALGIWRALEPARNARGCAARDGAGDVTALADDFAHLYVERPGLPRPWSRSLALAAQQVLRRFVRRTPGYGGSHLRYTQHNFLDAAATVEAEAGRIVVRLTRPPLALILNLAGLNRGERRWALLDARPFALFTEG